MKKVSLNIAYIIFVIVTALIFYNLNDYSVKDNISSQINYKVLRASIPFAGKDQTKIEKKHLFIVVKNSSNFTSILNPNRLPFLLKNDYINLIEANNSPVHAYFKSASERAPPLI